MNIDTSKLTYRPVPRATQPVRNFSTETKQMEASKVKPKEAMTPNGSKEVKAPEAPPANKADWTSPLSNYLSPEEKAMLNELFPPQGRDVGIRAYRQGQQPVRNVMELGKRIDVKT